MTPEQKIEQAAVDFAGNRKIGNPGYPTYEAILMERGFIAGAKSEEAKEYWSKQFEKEKIEFAIETLNNLEFNPRDSVADFVITIKYEIKELQQKLSEL